MENPADLSEKQGADSAPSAALMLDITHEKCPMTFVRTRLALDGMAAGRVLVVRLRGEEPHRNVRRSVLALGHTVLAEQAAEDGSIVLTVQKKDPAPAG